MIRFLKSADSLVTAYPGSGRVLPSCLCIHSYPFLRIRSTTSYTVTTHRYEEAGRAGERGMFEKDCQRLFGTDVEALEKQFWEEAKQLIRHHPVG